MGLELSRDALSRQSGRDEFVRCPVPVLRPPKPVGLKTQLNQSLCSFNTAFHCLLWHCKARFVLSRLSVNKNSHSVCESVETLLQLPLRDQPASWWAKQQQSRKQQEERPRSPLTRLILTGLMKLCQSHSHRRPVRSSQETRK